MIKYIELSNILVNNGFIKSKREYRTLLDNGALRLNGVHKLSDNDDFEHIINPCVIKIGKKKWIKLNIANGIILVV